MSAEASILALRKDHLPKGISKSTLSHFAALPLAHDTLLEDEFIIFPSSRHITHSGRGHTLTGKTWKTAETIVDLLSLYRPPSSTKPAETLDEATRGEVRRFYTFGTDLNAHPDILHGGVVATILDSSLGHAVGMHLSSISSSSSSGSGGLKEQDGMFTVQLNISYKSPVRTPGSVRVRAWVVRVEGEGRKVWAEGVVESWLEGKVVVNARAEGMWLSAGKKKGKGKL